MSGYRMVVGEVIRLVQTHGRLTLWELADQLGTPADEIRRQVDAYSQEGLSPSLWPSDGVAVYVEPSDPNDPPVPSDDDIVDIRGDPSRAVLGVELFGASVFGPLYEAAADLMGEEPDNVDLASACQKLLDVFLPGVRPNSGFGSGASAKLVEAIHGSRRVRITYSRQWNPGTTERVIEPYALTRTSRGREVDAGPVQPDGSIRTFLVNRIRAIEVLEETFVRPDEVEELIAATRRVTTVTGHLPVNRLWVLGKWAEQYRITGQDAARVTFEADLLPPVGWRAGLMMIAAGSQAHLDQATHDEEARALARELWAHHRLDEP